MAANGISTLTYKQQRQAAKLAAAATKRALSSRRSAYDSSQLPTLYKASDNFTGNVVDNANTGGLVVGRPWTSYAAGLYRSQYTGWPNQNTASVNFFDGKTPAASAVATNFNLTLTSGQTSLGYQWLGYFLPDYTGTWTISTNGANIDDVIVVWIGNTALTGYTTGNALLNISLTAGSNTISLTAGTYYPIRVQYANNSGPGSCTLAWSHPGAATPSTTWTGKLFYSSGTNGF